MNDGLFVFPGFVLLQIELQLLAFKHTAVCSAALAWSSSNASEKLALLDLLLQKSILFPFIVVFLLNFL